MPILQTGHDMLVAATEPTVKYSGVLQPLIA